MELKDLEITLYERESSEILSLVTSLCSKEFNFGSIRGTDVNAGEVFDENSFGLTFTWRGSQRCSVANKLCFYIKRHNKCKRRQDLILPFPSLHMNQNLGSPSLTLSTLNTQRQIPKLTLHFQQWLIFDNWDEQTLHLSNDIWPSHLSCDTVTKLLPLLISRYPLQHDASIIVKILNGYMMFRVDLGDEFAESIGDVIFIYKNDIPIQIIQKPSHDNATNSSSQIKVPIYSGNISYDFHENLKRRIFFNLNTESHSLHLNHHSILISSPEGSGKTFFLQNLERQLSNFSSPSFFCYYHDAKVLNKNIDEILEINQAMSTDHSRTSREGTEDEFQRSLSFILSQLFPHISRQQYSSTAALVLLVDNLEIFFQPFLQDDDRSTAASSSYLPYYLDQYYRLIAYHLHITTQYLRQPQTNTIRRVYFIGGTSLNEKQLPKSSAGCFEMELVLPLPKPSFKDHCLLINDFLNQILLSMSSLTIDSTKAMKLMDWMEEEIGSIFQGSNQDIPTTMQQENNQHTWAYQIAGLTQGYLPGDLRVLLRKMVLVAHARMRKEGKSEENGVITWDDVTEALATTSLRAMSELEVIHNYDQGASGVGSLSWDTFIGYDEVKDHLRFILSPLLKPTANNHRIQQHHHQGASNSSLFEKYRYPRGMILYGPSGNGKTLLSKIISKQLNASLMNIQCTDILSKYFGETESKIRHIFQVAHQVSPTILFFDEFDAIAHKREMQDEASGNGGGSSHGNIYNRILSTFLNELDGIAVSSTSPGSSFVLVIVACKSLEILDEALIRPGRLQHHIHLDYPSDADIVKILHHGLSPYEFIIKEEHLQSLRLVPNLSISLIQEIIEKMKLAAVKEHINLLESNSNSHFKTDSLGKIEERHWQSVMEPYLPPKPQSSFTTDTWSFDGEVTFNSGI